MDPLLLITATPMEGRPVREALQDLVVLDFPLGQLYRGALSQSPIFLAHLGIGKVNTAAGLALALHYTRASAVIQFGIGGAFPGSALGLGDVAVASSETHLDSGVRDRDGWQDMKALGFALLEKDELYYNVFPTDPELSAKLARATGAVTASFGTSETVTGRVNAASELFKRHHVLIESMEGAAAVQVCTALGVPFAEIRAVSNPVGERDKSHWNIPLAIQNVDQAILTYMAAIKGEVTP